MCNKVHVLHLILSSFIYLFVQSGETVLIGAVRGGHVEIVRALLNKYADVDVKGQVDSTLTLFLSHILRV